MIFFVGTILSLVLSNSAWGLANPPKELTFQIAPGSKGLEFLAIGRPSMLRIKGSGGPITGSLKLLDHQLKGELTIPTESLETGISLRDSHLKETYLPVKEFPQATLVLDPVKMDPGFSESLSQKKTAFSGKLKLRGKESPIAGAFEIKAGKLEAEFSLKISDFGIPIPTYLGVTVADSVENKVTLQLVKQ